MIETSRMASLGAMAMQGVPEDEICKNDEERDFYRDMVDSYELMRKNGIKPDVPNEFP
jgi:hypothetical protein